MSLWGRSERDFQGMTADEVIRLRNAPSGTGVVNITNDTAMRHSAVWACIRLRADLESTFPVDTFRDIDGYQIEMPTPPIFTAPGSNRVTGQMTHWMYAGRQNLDRAGNNIGIITERNAITSPLYPEGLPSRIDLQDIGNCAVIERKGIGTRYRINNKEYLPSEVWHEVQFPVAGLPVGLSAIAHAAWSISETMSMQQFALDWFRRGGVPKSRMKNTARKLTDKERTSAKQWWDDTVNNGDLLVTGADWEFDMISAQTAGMEWLEGRRFGLSDISRFFGCPADLIDAAISNPGTVNYASITQRNLQFLIMNMAPGVIRREVALSTLLPRPRYVKLNTDALLRMDPEMRGKTMNGAITTRRMTVTEARALDNRLPLSPADEEEFVRLFGNPNKAPAVPKPAAPAAPAPAP